MGSVEPNHHGPGCWVRCSRRPTCPPLLLALSAARSAGIWDLVRQLFRGHRRLARRKISGGARRKDVEYRIQSRTIRINGGCCKRPFLTFHSQCTSIHSAAHPLCCADAAEQKEILVSPRSTRGAGPRLSEISSARPDTSSRTTWTSYSHSPVRSGA